MTENIASTEAQKKTKKWIPWMRVAGIAYALVPLFFLSGLSFGGGAFIIPLSNIACLVLLVATLAFVGGWTRYLDSKK